MLCPWTYEICLWNCSSALESVATEIKRYKSEIGIGIGKDNVTVDLLSRWGASAVNFQKLHTLVPQAVGLI